MFKPIPEHITYPNLEEEVLQFWKTEHIFQRSLESRADAPLFSFYEGPPTVNGKPGVHHLAARTVKDLICRYKALRGYKVPRMAGWDTHGLPVEIAVEKELGLTNKKEILTYGIDKFNQTSRDFVYRHLNNDGGWRFFTERMGYWLDLDKPYITCTNHYIESVWWAISQFFTKGLIYKSYKVVPQSPTIETPLSSHELALGYKEVRDPSVYVKMPITHTAVVAAQGASILVWTTTPWTLMSNTALCVGSEIEYSIVKHAREIKQGDTKDSVEEILILASERLSVLDGTYEVLATCFGKELIGTQYEPPFPYLVTNREQYPAMHTVLAGDFVSTEDGSGIVHIAPAFGQDDFEIGRAHGLPFFQPVTPGGRFSQDITEFAGRTVKTFKYQHHTEEGADKDIIIALKKAGRIYKSSNDYLHKYPHCWRTGNPVIYYARESWFIKSPAYKERMVALNNEINWQPSEIGTGRFGIWLEDVKDWSLSRDRYWGTPLPLWVSADGTDVFAVGSIEELCSGLYVMPDGSLKPVREAIDELKIEIDLHRPFVDNIVFVKNGVQYRRVHEVIDVWFDSGAMPFAQFHYPFENRELFEQSFPADYICEAIDQTRGWFYTLHNIATALFDKPAFKNVVVNELILDKDGKKMSKSLGNTIDPFDIMNKYGADAVRWYLVVNNPPWRTTRFNPDDIAQTVIADFFRSVRNVYAFFVMYANIDGFTGIEEQVAIADRPEIDRWLLSRYTSVLQKYHEHMDSYDMFSANRLVQEFAVNDVSNWYVRRNRRRFWKGDNDRDKLSAYQTLREVFMGMLSMIAPTSPFLAEALYGRLRTANEPISVHLAYLPIPNQDHVDSALERRMKTAQDIVFLARSLREKSKIKTRQPLQRILVPVLSPQHRRDIQAVESVILEEINVKAIEYVTDESGIVKRSARPNFKTIGKKFGKETQSVANAIKAISAHDLRRLESEGVYTLEVHGKEYLVERDDVDIVSEDIEGWLVASQNGLTVALDTELNDGLRHEGVAREFVNRLQNLRKDSGFHVTDRIRVRYNVDGMFKIALEAMSQYIKEETLCEDFSYVEGSLPTIVAIDETSVSVSVERM